MFTHKFYVRFDDGRKRLRFALSSGRYRPVVKFWSTVLHSQEFTVEHIATFFDVPSTIHREYSRDLLPSAARGGIQILGTKQGLWHDRDQFDKYACPWQALFANMNRDPRPVRDAAMTALPRFKGFSVLLSGAVNRTI